MSLATFIAHDFSALEHHMQMMEAEQKPDDEEEEMETTEKITTEDILGKFMNI